MSGSNGSAGPDGNNSIIPARSTNIGPIKTPFQNILKIIIGLCLTDENLRQKVQYSIVHMRFINQSFGTGNNNGTKHKNKQGEGVTIIDVAGVDNVVAFYINLLGIIE